MAKAFILLSQEPGTPPIINEIRRIPEAVETFPVYGVYDLIVKVETKTMRELKDIVNYQIRRIEGITATLTMIVID